MPDWAAWPFPAEDPYPAYHAARAGGAVQWNEQLGANLVLSYEHAAAVLRGPEWKLTRAPAHGCLLPSADQVLSRSCGAVCC